MRYSRRGFIATTAALAAGQAAGPASGQDQPVWDGRAPIAKPELDELLTRKINGQYTCLVTPQATEGPYYYLSSERRRDITEGRPGVPLRLGVRIADAASLVGGCAPLSGAVVDLWQADAEGMYSNVGTDLQTVDTIGQTFMRGHQVTDETGYVEFDTVVPGWELVAAPAPINVLIRTTHIHVKVFHETLVTTAQLFFPDEYLDELYAGVDPYRLHTQMTAPGVEGSFNRPANAEDPLFVNSQVTPMAIERTGAGVSALATIGLLSMGTRGGETLFR